VLSHSQPRPSPSRSSRALYPALPRRTGAAPAARAAAQLANVPVLPLLRIPIRVLHICPSGRLVDVGDPDLLAGSQNVSPSTTQVTRFVEAQIENYAVFGGGSQERCWRKSLRTRPPMWRAKSKHPQPCASVRSTERSGNQPSHGFRTAGLIGFLRAPGVNRVELLGREAQHDAGHPAAT
jgi:hypothetical protein